MTRLVPRPDWTPVELVLAVRAAVWEQGVTPEMAANRPTVLALFRPAEEPGIITATADHARPLEPIPWDDDYPRETPAPVAPPQAEERKEWPPKRPKPVALIPTPTCSEERDPWGNAESRVRTLAHEANNEAGADVAIHLFRAAHDAALAALRSELSASQREVERLRQQLDPPTQSGSFGATTAKVAGKCIQCNGDIYHDPHHIGEYLHVCVPSGENRSVDAGSPPAGGTAG